METRCFKMSKRTLENCHIVYLHEKLRNERPKQEGGKCDGYRLGRYNEELCDICKKCKLNTEYEEIEE